MKHFVMFSLFYFFFLLCSYSLVMSSNTYLTNLMFFFFCVFWERCMRHNCLRSLSLIQISLYFKLFFDQKTTEQYDIYVIVLENACELKKKKKIQFPIRVTHHFISIVGPIKMYYFIFRST